MLLLSSNILNVACTERLLVFCNTNLSPYRRYSGTKNSSPHDGENVFTPSKSTIIVSSATTLFKTGSYAKSASLPDWREVSVVPDFFNATGMGIKFKIKTL